MFDIRIDCYDLSESTFGIFFQLPIAFLLFLVHIVVRANENVLDTIHFSEYLGIFIHDRAQMQFDEIDRRTTSRTCNRRFCNVLLEKSRNAVACSVDVFMDFRTVDAGLTSSKKVGSVRVERRHRASTVRLVTSRRAHDDGRYTNGERSRGR